MSTTPSYEEAYEHAAKTVAGRVAEAWDFENWFASLWSVVPHQRTAWKRGMAAATIAVAFGVDLSAGGQA